MTKTPKTPWHQLTLLAAGCLLFAASVGGLGWYLAHHILRLSNEQALGAAGVFGVPVLVFGPKLVELVRDTQQTPAAVTSVDPPELERWRRWLLGQILDRRVRGASSALVQMVRQSGTVDPMLKNNVQITADAEAKARLKIRGHTVPLSALADEWDAAPTRLVILGEPGYGKTAAALMLLRHINDDSAAEAGRSVAELFPLAEWYRWQGNNPRVGIERWLADQLVLTHRGVTPAVGQALVEAGLVIPILDGLDEVPAAKRAACRDAIEAYAGPAAPFRPFVLTCRAREYLQLGDWVPADRQVALIGLQPEQIAHLLDHALVGGPGGLPCGLG